MSAAAEVVGPDFFPYECMVRFWRVVEDSARCKLLVDFWQQVQRWRLKWTDDITEKERYEVLAYNFSKPPPLRNFQALELPD